MANNQQTEPIKLEQRVLMLEERLQQLTEKIVELKKVIKQSQTKRKKSWLTLW